jgi:hypothetical protein
MRTAGEWERAQVDFFEAFRNYDEAGSPQRIQVLKYLVLANMLMGSKINPFDSQETQPYVIFFCRKIRYWATIEAIVIATRTTPKLWP